MTTPKGAKRTGPQPYPRESPDLEPLLGDSQDFQEAGTAECVAMGKADHEGAYTQLPVCDERMMLAAVTLTGPNSGKLRGLVPHTRPSGATAAASHNNAVSRVMATLAVR